MSALLVTCVNCVQTFCDVLVGHTRQDLQHVEQSCGFWVALSLLLPSLNPSLNLEASLVGT